MDAFSKLGIDGWGILLYLVNFGIVLFIMHRYLYGPLLAYLDERRATIKRNIEEAEKLRNSFEEEIRKQESEAERKMQEMNTRIAEAKKHAKETAKELIADADARREIMLTEAAKEAEAMKNDALNDAEKEALKRMETVIRHVLQNAVPEKIIQESVSQGWKQTS